MTGLAHILAIVRIGFTRVTSIQLDDLVTAIVIAISDQLIY